jgi:hypothetical protein
VVVIVETTVCETTPRTRGAERLLAASLDLVSVIREPMARQLRRFRFETIGVSPMSQTWLRSHDTESGKRGSES